MGDGIDFDGRAQGQRTCLNGGAGGVVGGEVLGVNGIHLGEIGQITEIDGRFEHVVHRGTGGFDNGFEVFEHLAGFGFNAAFDHFHRVRVQADLSSREHEIAGDNADRIRGFNLGDVRGGDDFFVGHGIGSWGLVDWLSVDLLSR